jgi:hypothetical protein
MGCAARLGGRRVVRPAIPTGVMRVRHVHGRAEVGPERLQLSERERIVERHELSLGMALRDIGEDGWRFAQHAALGCE